MTSDITNDPREWKKVEQDWVGKEDLWQHVVISPLYSTDGGRTYYSLDDSLDPEGNPKIYTSKEHI